jgi:hypothetical protein
MKRLFFAMVLSLVLGLVGGVSRAWAGDGLLPPPSGAAQTATQSNDGSNTASQEATSEPTVISGPNIAVANGSSCSPCGGSGTTTQDSGNEVDSSASNTATQSNNQSNDAGQTQTVDGGGSGGTSQSLDQTNTAANTADQDATSKPIVVSGPNVAILNSGDVKQNSGNDVDSSASNSATQSNKQSNDADQSQSVSDGGCCYSGDVSQEASQSNTASNDADQTAKSEPIVISGGNYAILNKGDVRQDSGNDVDSWASNRATQSNKQSNDADQSQTVSDGSCCHSGDVSQDASQSNTGSNDADQSAKSEPVVISGPNVAVLNKGDVRQDSGNDVDSWASNKATQSNTQSNDLEQSQKVEGGGCCRDDCKSSCEPRQCEPEKCEPKRCEPKGNPCKRKDFSPRGLILA